jgi:RNA polymerase sigma-70 factor (ECF subfamily)
MAAVSATPHGPSDEALLARVARGDRAGLDELFRRYRAVAFRVAYRLLGNEADALDAVQEGFVNALTNLPGFRGQSSFKTWLLRIVTNAALDLGRTRRRRESRAVNGWAGDDMPAPPTANGDLDRADLRDALDRALAVLPEAQRQTFVLHVDGGLSYREVADALGISIGTVMSRLFYARQRLKLLLASHVLP